MSGQPDTQQAEAHVRLPLDREAARQRLRAKRRARAADADRRTAEGISGELRHAATVTDSPPVAQLLAAIAQDMDDYLGTMAQATGTGRDHPVHQAALALARHINGKESDHA